MKVELKTSELVFAAQIGVKRQLDALENTRKTRFVPSGWWDVHINGACGELAVARALNCFWCGGHFRSRDVAEYQVRTTHHQTGRLTIHDDDNNNDIFILVIGDGRTRVFDIVGWIKAIDGKRPEYWVEMQSGTWDFMVPQSALHPFEELLKERKEDAA
jgi:hypothetical protein